MNKTQILALKQAYEFNNVNLGELFAIACEDASKIRYCEVSITMQCQIRAKNLAFPLAIMLLDLSELIEKYYPNAIE